MKEAVANLGSLGDLCIKDFAFSWCDPAARWAIVLVVGVL